MGIRRGEKQLQAAVETGVTAGYARPLPRVGPNPSTCLLGKESCSVECQNNTGLRSRPPSIHGTNCETYPSRSLKRVQPYDCL